MENELKQIPLFDNYCINKNGEVYNQKLKRWLKGSINKQNQYKYVEMTRNDGVKQKKYIHRLIAEIFIPNPNNLPFVNHKDENRQNNNINNLEWCTPQYNTTYGNSIKKAVETKRKTTGFGEKKIIMYDKDTKKQLQIFNSITEASNFLGKGRTGITNISHALIDRKSHLAYNYYWEYLKET